jgi:hypothetical protein
MGVRKLSPGHPFGKADSRIVFTEPEDLPMTDSLKSSGGGAKDVIPPTPAWQTQRTVTFLHRLGSVPVAFLAAAKLCFLSALAFPGHASFGGDEFAHFENKIRPVLVERCYECHSTEQKVKGGLALDTKDGLLKGGDSGPALNLQAPEKSLILKALRHQDDLQMPPKSERLPESIANDFAAWIYSGAPDPRSSEGKPAPGIDWEKARRHWAFLPVKRPLIPGSETNLNPVDRFIRARLSQEGLRPSPEAPARTRIRRLSLTLRGLPPAIEDVESFEKDPSEARYLEIVDRYLASREFGEKWARHWLDVARYAEDQAHGGGKVNRMAWKYRDWVINAFARDLPYNTFIRHQIAADFLPENERIENLAALGFFGLGPQYYKLDDAPRAIADELDDRVDVMSRGLLGLTVSCARCHDHKYDPIPTQDYYSLAGVFHSSRLVDTPEVSKREWVRYQVAYKQLDAAEFEFKRSVRTLRHPALLAHCADTAAAFAKLDEFLEINRRDPSQKLPKELEALKAFVGKINDNPKYSGIVTAWRSLGAAASESDKARGTELLRDTLIDAVEKELKAFLNKKPDREVVDALFGEKGVAPFRETWRESLSTEQKDELKALEAVVAEQRKALGPEIPLVHAIAEGKPDDLKTFIRGNPTNHGALAPRRFLRILAGDERAPFARGSGRWELAEAIADPSNPLTARVFVNRLWLWTFGCGIVNTPSNFGTLGERPSHPELLDWLAAEFMENGWSTKSVLRLLVTSRTFQQSSQPTPASREKDANNALLSRFQSRRMSIEIWRDSVMAACGSLEKGRDGMTFALSEAGATKRTVYARVSRRELATLLRLFDFPDPNITSERRLETTIPQQQLFMLNSPFVLAQATQLSQRVCTAAKDAAGQIRMAYRFALGREPESEELEITQQFLSQKDPEGDSRAATQERLQRFCQTLLISNEFIFVD